MFAMWIAKLILFVIAVEAVTEILVDSKLFKPRRRAIKLHWKKINESGPYLYSKTERTIYFFLNAWASCGYCLSYIVAAGAAFFVDLPVSGNMIVDYFLAMFVVARLANWLHEWTQIIKRGRVKYVDVTHNFPEEAK